MTGQVDCPTWGRFLVRLASGSTGEAVAVLQRQLNEKRRTTLAVDSTFRSSTLSAVRSFQRHAGWP